MEIKKKIYFPNLNGIRFIAAFLVIIHHIEQFKFLFGIENYWDNLSIQNIGPLGVVLFFVLSGFLITYLLLVEEKETNTIAVKKFYIRRMLRIWPLYYIIVGLSFFVLPEFSFLSIAPFTEKIGEHFYTKLFLFLFFLPNIALVCFAPIPFASQTWSVGVEEQFYIIWPIIMKKIKNKIRFLIGFILFFLGLKYLALPFCKSTIYWHDYLEYFSVFLDGFSIDCMAIGALFALLVYQKSVILEYLFRKAIQIIVYLMLTFLLVFGIKFSYFHYEIYAVLFAIIITNLAINPKSIVHLEIPVFDFLGKISYGLYMYHPLAIVVSIQLLLFFKFSNGIQLYLLSFAVTVFLASFSYFYIESTFLRLKNRFSVILSGDTTKSLLK